MKLVYRLFLGFILCLNMLFAGIVNVNPDPGAESWTAGGLKIPDNFDRSKLNFVTDVPVKADLPSRVDNSQNKYFRPVFNQVGGSCAQAAGTGYAFTYEIDRLRDISADIESNQYPTHFTYNFLNGGTGENGSWWADGWDIIKSVGIMNVEDYGGHFAEGGNSRWVSGVEEWSRGNYNRIESYQSIDVSDSSGLEILKNWFDNHLEDSEYGGLSVFAAGATGYSLENLPEGTHEAGKKIITSWGPDVNHAMTYVGYDDSVRFDVNGDGRFTNDIDINGDRIVDMRDWEIGAVIVANSWGTGFGDDGFCYQMYRLLAEPYENGGIFYSFTDIVTPVEVYEPRYIMEVKMKHDQRNRYKIYAGYSDDLNDETASDIYSAPYMRFQGGSYYPQGGRDEEDKYIEFTMDVTEIASNTVEGNPFKLFFVIEEEDNYSSFSGKIISVNVVDKETGKRYYSDNGYYNIINDDRTFVGVIIDENTFVPSGLSAFGGDGLVKLEWEDNAYSKNTLFECYNVYRNGQLYVQGITEAAFTDNGVENGTVYDYMVSASFSGSYSGELFSGTVQSMPGEASELPFVEDFETGAESIVFSGDMTGWIITDENSFNSEYCDLTGNQTLFLGANPDLAGNYTVVQDYALFPVMNLGFYDNVSFEFDYILNNASEDYYYCDIDLVYRTSENGEWNLLKRLDDSSSWRNISVAIPNEVTSCNTTRFALYFNDYKKWAMGGGAVDNIKITGNMAAQSPAILTCMPLEEEICLTCVQEQEFSIEVSDPDTDISQLDITWFIDGKEFQKGGEKITVFISEPGNFEVKVTVDDGYNTVSKVWLVTLTGSEDNIPERTVLYQNYPNPFNPSTVIRFDNSETTGVNINIYDSKGALVRRLVNRNLAPGSYSFRWDGRNGSGGGLSSGVYYYRIKAGDYVRTKKALLFK